MPLLWWTGRQGREERRLALLNRIGRAIGNDIQLPDATVSACHAHIVAENGHWFFQDNNSSNGSFVNGQPCTRTILSDGDVILLGGTELTFQLSDAPNGVSEASSGRDGLGMSTIPRSHPRTAGEVQRSDAPGCAADARAMSKLTSLSVTSMAQPRADEDRALLARRLHVSYEISRATAATLDLAEVLDRVASALFGILESAGRIVILLLEPNGNDMTAVASRHRDASREDKLEVSRTALNEAVANREALLCLDTVDDSRYSAAQSIINLRIRSLMVAPLIFREQVLGAIYVDTRGAAGEFTQDDLELLTLASSEVAGRVANAQLHAKVVAADRLAVVGQTVAGLAHCVKNVLQSLKGGAFIVDKGLGNQDLSRVNRGWGMVKRGNEFLEDLVLDLLSFSKDRSPQYESVDLNALCGEVCSIAFSRAQAGGITVEMQPASELGLVQLDATAIRRCLLNLVLNAVDACVDGKGQVTVSVRPPEPDGLVRICVADNGCGMSDETKAKLFTAFFSTKGSRGTGLGLPVTQKIVREHGGRIDVDSKVGRGTTFTVFLPASPEATNPTKRL